MASFISNAYLASAAGMPVWHGSGHELGILDAAMLHSCVAAANCTLPSDILSYQRVDDLIVKPIEIRDSYAIPSPLPGLGVELDEDAVRRYHAG
jgi:L-alanine-DL-glutamate epimerase-like enolase superfamily enzyme